MSYGMAPCLDCAPEKPCGSSLCHDGKIEVCGNCGSEQAVLGEAQSLHSVCGL